MGGRRTAFILAVKPARRKENRRGIGLNIRSLLIALAAFFFSVWQFFAKRTRRRREATIHAFDELEETVFFDPRIKSSRPETRRFASP